MSYAAYRPMNELWLATIPKHWDCHKIKHIFSERIEKGYPDEPLLVASQNMGVVFKDIYGNRTVEATKDLHNLKLVCIGDFVISLRSFQGGLEYAYNQGIISPAYTVMMPGGQISGGYFRYFAKSRLFIELLQMCVTGIREGQNIDYGKLKNHLIPLPPRDEQDQIVRYLDWKVSQINKLINAKRRQIVLLQEQRQAVIEDILSNISAQTLLCRYLGSLQNGISESGDFFTDGTPFVNYSDVYKNEILPPTVNGVAKANPKQQKTYSVEKGDIFFTRTSETIDEVGLTAVCDETIPQAVFSGFIIRFRPKNDTFHNQYAKYFFRSKKVRDYFTQEMNLVTRVSLGQTLLKNLPILLPDLETQRNIAIQLDEQCGRLDRLIYKLNDEITLCTEYRTRLISDVVTGKLDVRGVTVPEYEAVVDTSNEELLLDTDTEQEEIYQ